MGVAVTQIIYECYRTKLLVVKGQFLMHVGTTANLTGCVKTPEFGAGAKISPTGSQK